MEFNGTGDVPKGRVHPPIYVGINGKVVDVSYGGYEFYYPGKDKNYNIFAGKDATVALATMKATEEAAALTDVTDLTEEERKVADDWEALFINKKMYPVVGRVVD